MHIKSFTHGQLLKDPQVFALLPPEVQETFLDPYLFSPLIFVSYKQNTPTAIIAAAFYESFLTCKILALSGDLSAADSLMKQLRDSVRKKGAIQIAFVHEDIPELTKACQANGLTHSQTAYHKLTFDMFVDYHLPWLGQRIHYPPGVHSFPWERLNSLQRGELQRKAAEGTFPAGVSPFQSEKTLELPLSFGVQNREKEVVGWSICHRISTDTVRYTALYMQPDLRKSPFGVMPLLESIRKQQKMKEVRYANFLFNPQIVPSSWIAFVEKRLLPHAIERTLILQSWWNTAE